MIGWLEDIAAIDKIYFYTFAGQRILRNEIKETKSGVG